MSTANEHVVARSISGTADQHQLNSLIADAWRDALNDPRERAEIASLLGAKESELDPINPPLRAEVRGSGTFGAEVLIALAIGFSVGFASGFGDGFGDVFGREAGKKAAAALRDLWIDHIRNRVNPPGSGHLGPEKEDVERDREDGSHDLKAR